MEPVLTVGAKEVCKVCCRRRSCVKPSVLWRCMVCGAVDGRTCTCVCSHEHRCAHVPFSSPRFLIKVLPTCKFAAEYGTRRAAAASQCSGGERMKHL